MIQLSSFRYLLISRKAMVSNSFISHHHTSEFLPSYCYLIRARAVLPQICKGVRRRPSQLEVMVVLSVAVSGIVLRIVSLAVSCVGVLRIVLGTVLRIILRVVLVVILRIVSLRIPALISLAVLSTVFLIVGTISGVCHNKFPPVLNLSCTYIIFNRRFFIHIPQKIS